MTNRTLILSAMVTGFLLAATDSEAQRRRPGAGAGAAAPPALDDSQSADEPELLAHDRKNEIRVSERQKKHLLLPLCEAKTLDSARPDRNQRLHNLKTRALLIRPWIKKRDQAFQSPGYKDQQPCRDYERRRCRHCRCGRERPF